MRKAEEIARIMEVHPDLVCARDHEILEAVADWGDTELGDAATEFRKNLTEAARALGILEALPTVKDIAGIYGDKSFQRNEAR